MPSSLLDSTHGRTTLGVTCQCASWIAHKVGRSQAWNVIIGLGQHTRLEYVRLGMPSSPVESHTIERRRVWHVIIALGNYTQSDDVGVACNHRPWIAHNIKPSREWHARKAVWQHTQSEDIGCGMPLSPLGSTHGGTTSGMTCHPYPWVALMIG